MPDVQAELFPLVSAESVEALYRQAIAEFREIGPELSKDRLLLHMGELSLWRQVIAADALRVRTGKEYRQRQAVRHVDFAAPVLRFTHRWQSRPRRVEYDDPGAVSPLRR